MEMLDFGVFRAHMQQKYPNSPRRRKTLEITGNGGRVLPQ